MNSQGPDDYFDNGEDGEPGDESRPRKKRLVDVVPTRSSTAQLPNDRILDDSRRTTLKLDVPVRLFNPVSRYIAVNPLLPSNVGACFTKQEVTWETTAPHQNNAVPYKIVPE
jgi:hypothetical protein